MSLGKILDISKNSLAVYRKALDVTSSNISNASNEDYSRQTVSLGTERSDGISGSGVKLMDITRAKADLVEKQIITYNSKYSEAEKRSTVISQVESLLQEPSDSGLDTYLTSFYNSWQQLSVNPSSTALRGGVTQAAANLVNKFNNVYSGIEQIKNDIGAELKTKVVTLNDNLSQIHDLNRQIFEAKNTGQDSGDLQDKRSKLVADISKETNVNATENDAGDIVISIGGIYAADRFSSTTFEVGQSNGELYVGIQGGQAKMQLSGGEIYAMTDTYTNKLPDYQRQLDEVATALTESVNAIHQQGTNVKGVTGLNFFDEYQPGNLSINSKILKDSNNIAISADGTSGNGELAIKISESKKNKVINGNTIMDYYSSLVSTVGSDKALSDQNAVADNLVLSQLKNQKSAVTGVSLDEEMTNVIKYQRSYDASAKLIKVADELLQTILNMV